MLELACSARTSTTVHDRAHPDLAMPGPDGIGLARAVGADHRSDISILLVTASASPEDIGEAREAGVTAHLTKPCKLAELRDQVAVLLGGA